MKKPSVALLGPATYSEEAFGALAGSLEWDVVYERTIADVFASTMERRTMFSVIPIENTIEGSVHVHIDWFVHRCDVPVQAEWSYRIEMHVLGAPIIPVPEWRHVTTVYSHPVAFTQCNDFLRNKIPQALCESTASTADGARKVQQEWQTDRTRGTQCVALGTASAAERYGLTIWQRGVQDQENNATRFWMIGYESPGRFDQGQEGIQEKTTLLLVPADDAPGGLHQLLSAFAWRKLNLTRIESRPTKKQLGTYVFSVDVQASIDSVLLQGAMAELRAIGCHVRVIGSYPCYPLLSYFSSSSSNKRSF